MIRCSCKQCFYNIIYNHAKHLAPLHFSTSATNFYFSGTFMILLFLLSNVLEISATIDADDNFELMIRNAWRMAGGEVQYCQIFLNLMFHMFHTSSTDLPLPSPCPAFHPMFPVLSCSVLL